MRMVITYRLAYVDRQVTLCERHAEDPKYPLGPVTHGQRHGACDVCAVIAKRLSRECARVAVELRALGWHGWRELVDLGRVSSASQARPLLGWAIESARGGGAKYADVDGAIADARVSLAELS